MKHIPSLLWCLLLGVPGLLSGQDCDCLSSFQWAEQLFRENDAGYAYALAQKGEAAYEQHTEAMEAQARATEDMATCAELIGEWMQFFRSAHLGVEWLGEEETESESEALPQKKRAIRARFKDWETLEVDLDSFRAYLSAKDTLDFEGIWRTGVYRIGIKKVDERYLGFIIEADGVYWVESQVKLRLEADGKAAFFMQDHSERAFEPDQVFLLGKSGLRIGTVSLEREWPVVPPEPEVARYIKVVKATSPYVERIDSQTVLLRIPSFNNSQKPAIDSVILAHRATILQTPSLIIDLRGNGGGSDNSYEELLPFLYTNPIRTVGVEFRSTPLNNQRMLDFAENPAYNFSPEEREWAREAYERLSAEVGAFVSLDAEPISVTRLDTVYPYPRSIGILINEENGSTAEQFLLAAKQSRKVKLFGSTTYGVLDISNMNEVVSPCETFKLYYSLSRSKRIPKMTIDEKGIQPDFYLDEQILPYQWIEFVAETLRE